MDQKRYRSRRPSLGLLASLGLLMAAPVFIPTAQAQRQMERLNRGVVAMRTGTSSVYVGWRLFGTEAAGTAFNVYRGSTKVNASPITGNTNLVDTGANLGAANTYTVRAVVGGVEQPASGGSFTLAANAPTQQYLRVPVQLPQGGTVPAAGTNPGGAYTYTPNDCSVGDVDGDGEYELFVKMEPTNAKDNSQDGITGNVYIDCYRLNGTRLWRIDLGRNIRAGAHYTQFMVYDFDGDGRAELACKTADATISGTGQVIGNGDANHRNSAGRILAGPEYFTLFNGQTGAILATANYNPPRGNLADWGDTYGNRPDRFLAGVAYLDGVRPSIIMARGYYERTVVAAWDWRNGQLTQRWTFTAPTGNAYAGQGDHSLSIADVDGNGTQEIVYGAMVLNANGTGRHSTGFRHGDALHVGDLDPGRAGLEVCNIQEPVAAQGLHLRNASTGALYWAKASAAGSSEGPGRGLAADIDAAHRGCEYWAFGGGIAGVFNYAGTALYGTTSPNSCNFAAHWDSDDARELVNGNYINKWNPSTRVDDRVLTATGCSSNNGTKSTPNLSADIFGDWREEIIWREDNNSALRIYTTTATGGRRIHTLMHDPQYRVAIAWQNVAYNQPPHPSFFIGYGMTLPPQPNPNITLVGNPPVAGDTYQAESATAGGATPPVDEAINAGYNGSGYVNFQTTTSTLTFSNVDGNGGGTKSLAIRYANGSGAARAGTLTVNGTTTAISFPATSSWTTWNTLNVNITLNNNTTNTIVLSSNGSDLANIDQITVP
jgi:rhamnogalacturonan endolyase